jgi:hypothetical protein
MSKSRLNLLRALPDHASEPDVQQAVKRYLTHVGPSIERLEQLDARAFGGDSQSDADA